MLTRREFVCVAANAVFAYCVIAAFAVEARADALEAGFKNPPMSARPQTWWHWMNGNVTKEGITADLEAMKEIGLGGATLFDAGCGVPSGPLAFASPEWFDCVKHAAAEARRLGLEICLPNCSGWSSSGGPWNKVEDNMKELVRSEARFTGPRHVREKLPPLPNAHGFAADIAVVAVPVPPAEQMTMERAGGIVTAPSKLVREISFPEPFAADGMFFRIEHDWLWEVAGDVKVETSDDGRVYSELMTADATLALRAGWDRTERYRPFPREVKARFYRMTFDFRVIGRDPGDPERLKKTVIASVRVGRAKSLSNLCDKTFAKRMSVKADPDTAAADQVVAKDAVRVLGLSEGGVLDWEVPSGEWRVIRLGFAANGKKNHPASDFGSGFEIDKLSPAALDRHFEGYAAKLVRHLGPLAGDVSSGLAGILVDSYEIGAQNWTDGFEREFARRRGYDIAPYLPVLAGVIVGSVDESERFLEDFRRTVADLFVAGYSEALAKKCHQYGLKLWLEPYGNCPCDDLEYGDPVDLPMSEFWSRTNGDGRYTDTGNSRIPAYLAHVWGRRYVGAEAFTACPPFGGRWTTTPFAIKAQGDRAFARGINRLIFHRFCHQPFVKPGAFAAPGFTLGIYGMHLDRTQTWWKQGRPYMDYLARCQWMLQEGRNVADVIFWHGEEAPSRGGHVVGWPKDFQDHPVPLGFAKDVCSTRALKALKVVDGKVVAPGGTIYEMLVLQDVSEMSSATLDAVGRLVDAGATVVAPRMPVKVPGLWHYPNGDAEVRSRAESIWRSVVAGGAEEGIKALGLAPDCICLSAPEGLADETEWIHRRCEGGVDVYFVACPNARAGDFTCSFRIDGRVPELWDAESGKTALAPKSWRRVGTRTEVTFTLPPSGSAFVVFRTATDAREGVSRAPEACLEECALKAAWRVTFPIGWYAGGSETKTVDMPGLVDWTSLGDDDLKYFSGTVLYEAEVPGELMRKALQAKAEGRRVLLDLGDVRNFAEVTFGGTDFPALWRPPYRVDVTDALSPADSRLTVKVTNLWPNRMIGDERLCAPDCKWAKNGGLEEIPAFIREGRPSPTGRKTFATWHHWKKDDSLLPSGLLGPVRFEMHD